LFGGFERLDRGRRSFELSTRRGLSFPSGIQATQTVANGHHGSQGHTHAQYKQTYNDKHLVHYVLPRETSMAKTREGMIRPVYP
jgi:hypothetical protein